MACFLVPAAEAVVTTVVSKVAAKNEKNSMKETGEVHVETFSTKLGRLSKMLWGGSALLAFEHVWHGEVTAFFPFLTAAKNPADLSEMFTEMSTVGVGMAVIVTVTAAVVNTVISKTDKKTMEEIN